MYFKRVFLSLGLLAISNLAFSQPTEIKIFHSKYDKHLSKNKVTELVKQMIPVEDYRKIAAQLIYNREMKPDHLLVFLFKKNFHSHLVNRIDVNEAMVPRKMQKNYKLTLDDYEQQPGISAAQAKCPDEDVAFIAFAPNDDDFEVGITKEVADHAEAHSLKTVRLLVEKATRENYLNYMACPKLKGNFYDGDANPDEITTYDGVLSHHDIETVLKNSFRFKVTNIWLACEAFNDPIKTSLINIAQSQKYAAGINDLLVGPSDRAAACAMKAAIDGNPMKAAFETCYKEFDVEADHWGFDGLGNDIFGT